jgi:hypothetical protein
VTAFSRALVTVVLAVAIAGGGCATGRADGVATLKVECSVPDATLWLDDVLLGRVSQWSGGGRIHPGFHRLEIRHPGHYTFYAEISLKEGAGTVVRADLHPLLE